VGDSETDEMMVWKMEALEIIEMNDRKETKNGK
jgi:hypothetical protein